MLGKHRWMGRGNSLGYLFVAFIKESTSIHAQGSDDLAEWYGVSLSVHNAPEGLYAQVPVGALVRLKLVLNGLEGMRHVFFSILTLIT